MGILDDKLAAKKATETSTKTGEIATIAEVKAVTAAEKIHAEVIKPPVGSFTITKRNLFINANGVHIKVVNDYLVPSTAEEKELCAHWVTTGHLVNN